MKVQKRPQTFDAIQVDLSPEGLLALEAFLRGPVTVQHRGTEAPVVVADGYYARAGDWLVSDSLLGLRHLTADAFTAHYKPAETP